MPTLFSFDRHPAIAPCSKLSFRIQQAARQQENIPQEAHTRRIRHMDTLMTEPEETTGSEASGSKNGMREVTNSFVQPFLRLHHRLTSAGPKIAHTRNVVLTSTTAVGPQAGHLCPVHHGARGALHSTYKPPHKCPVGEVDHASGAEESAWELRSRSCSDCPQSLCGITKSL